MKKFLFLLAVVITALQVSAADVNTSQAQAAASSFLRKQVASGRLKAAAASNLRLVKAEASVAKPAAVDYYIFNAEKSYVVVSGDDLAPQILMYGEEGSLDLDNVPPGMQWLLNKYKYQIDGLKAGTMTPVKLPKFATTPVAPLVLANWDQSAPYNNQCPTSGSRHAVTGCPATSLSMCYYKWKWPETFPAAAAINGSSSNGLSAAALPERAADWANIIDEYTGPSNTSYNTTQANAVAWLMRYAGQLIPDYMYGTSASGANDPEILEGCHNMGYTDAQYLLLTELQGSSWSGYSNGPQQYTDAQWNEYMLNELQNGRPIEYLAYDITSGQVSGHAFNVFGVNSNGQYYVNWGWSGDSNGYCTLHNFTTATGATGQSGSYVFKYGEAMIIGIEPPAGALTNPRITVNPSTLEMSTTVGTPVTATFTVTGANLTSNVALSLSGDNAFSLSTSSISASQAANGVTVTVTYNPSTAGTNEATVTLTSTDAETVTVKLNGTAEAAPLETYTPVMLEASDIAATSFKATWTDQTPAENVESYTLYVSAEPFKPAIALLDSLDGSKYTGSYANITLSAPWGGTSVKGGNGAVYTSGSSGKITYTIPAGYQNATFSFQVTTTSTNYGSGNITVGSTQTPAVGYDMAAGETHTWVVTASAGETITLTSSDASYSPDIAMIRVYSGNTTVSSYKMAETGDATYRVITGIKDKSYTVNGLTQGGTFYFYVVANYVNGTLANSNTEEVTLINSDLEVYTPVMQPADEQYITLTSFRADWTDQTPAENVASYTLEVNTKPTEPEQPAYVLMENADFTGLTAQVNSSNQYSNQVSNASSFLPSGWTATTGLFIDDGAIITGELTQNSSSYAFTVGSNTYDFTGYDKVTVELDGSIFSESYGTSITLQVATSQGSQNVTINSTDFTTQSVVLACAASDKITLTGVSGLCCISGIRIYAGDKTAALNLLLATETGGPDYRLIEGITPDKFYTVNDLTAGGTFLYRVKAIYTDGTESAWSNVEEVTLVETGHGYELGDVNHDGKVNIADVTRLIDYLLDNENVEICTICAEVKADGSINIGDVTALIDKLLTEGEETASIKAPKTARKYRQLAF